MKTTDLDEAKILARRFLSQDNPRTSSLPRSMSPATTQLINQDEAPSGVKSFKALVLDFLKHCGWSELNRKAMRPLLDSLVIEWGHYPIKQITPRMIDLFLSSRGGRDGNGLKAGTWNRYRACISAILQQAVRWGYIEENPCDRVERHRGQQVIPEALSEDQLDKLIEHLSNPYYRQLIRFAADTGLRLSEIRRLTWEDIDWDGNFLQVGHQTKTMQFRSLPMTRSVRHILELRRKETLIDPVGPIWVFGDIKKSLSNAGESAGIGHVHFHMLRHTFATRLLEKDVSLVKIKELMGHATMDMVLRYAKVRPYQLTSAIQMLDN